jgi:hypothetical protein
VTILTTPQLVVSTPQMQIVMIITLVLMILVGEIRKLDAMPLDVFTKLLTVTIMIAVILLLAV